MTDLHEAFDICIDDLDSTELLELFRSPLVDLFDDPETIDADDA